MDRIELDISDIDFESVDFNSGKWHWGCGGHPLQDHEWFIAYVDDDLVETRYKMPSCINKMLRMRYEYGQNDAKRSIQSALGL